MKTEDNPHPYYEEGDPIEETELLPHKMGPAGWVIVAFAALLVFTLTRIILIYEDVKNTTARFSFRLIILVLAGGITLEHYAHHTHTHSYTLPTLLFFVLCFYSYGVIHFITDPIIDLIFLPRQTISEIEKGDRK